MTFKVDYDRDGVKSGIADNCFYDAVRELRDGDYRVISIPELVDLRIASSSDETKDSKVGLGNSGTYTREGIIFIPRRGQFLVKESPILSFLRKIEESVSGDLYLDNETKHTFEQALEKAVSFSYPMGESSEEPGHPELVIPSKRIQEDPGLVWILGGEERARKYGEYLHENGQETFYAYTRSNKDSFEGPFANQVWVSYLSIDEPTLPHITDGHNAFCNPDYVRGIKGPSISLS